MLCAAVEIVTKQQEEDREDNTQYSKKEYWEERFTDEEHKEWLAGEYTAQCPVLTARC